jgi:signal transduction histidine kinase
MHDSLGHRLSLVSIQAAALEVAELPAPQRQAVHHLAGAARGALSELHDLVGALREGDDAPSRPPAAADVSAVVADFQAAGVRVTVREHGARRPLPGPTGQAAYRVVEEGLTNATRHAPGQPVTVSLVWEPDTLVVTMLNPLPDGAGPGAGLGGAPGRSGLGRSGLGLVGLGERVGAVEGLLDHRVADGVFRLCAMLPVDVEERDTAAAGRVRTLVLGFATAGLMFVVLPATMLLGVG